MDFEAGIVGETAAQSIVLRGDGFLVRVGMIEIEDVEDIEGVKDVEDIEGVEDVEGTVEFGVATDPL